MDLSTWLPSAVIIAVGIAALLTLFSAQHKARQADVEMSFQVLRVVAMGVQHSGWPPAFLSQEMEHTKQILRDTEAPGLIEAVLQGAK